MFILSLINFLLLVLLLSFLPSEILELRRLLRFALLTEWLFVLELDLCLLVERLFCFQLLLEEDEEEDNEVLFKISLAWAKIEY